MKKRLHGPSFYYATDKNIFDALSQHKVDLPTITKLFERRGIVVDKKTSRNDLAKYFARLTHDYYDHKDIAARLGIAPRRERITSMDVSGTLDFDDMKVAVESLKAELEATGDIVQTTRDGDNLTINVQYSTVNYKLSEFAQIQVRDGTIELVKTAEGFTVRNTHNEFMDDVRDSLLSKVETTIDAPLTKAVVSLFDVTTPMLRSKFFHRLIAELPGYVRRDVSEVYVYKPKPDAGGESDGESLGGGESDTHVERIFLRGNGVTRSEFLNSLVDDDTYYITKIVWTAIESRGDGHVFDIEAAFTEPKDCYGFSFILHGVFPLAEGAVSSRRRAPTKSEIDAISRVVESKTRELVSELREEFANGSGRI